MLLSLLCAQVMNILLGVLDDGRLTDSKGRTVSFANTVIIMTSNLGSDLLLEHGNSQMAKDLVMGVVKQHFRPEFLNRLDDVVMFEPLGQLQLREVASKMVRLHLSTQYCVMLALHQLPFNSRIPCWQRRITGAQRHEYSIAVSPLFCSLMQRQIAPDTMIARSCGSVLQ